MYGEADLLNYKYSTIASYKLDESEGSKIFDYSRWGRTVDLSTGSTLSWDYQQKAFIGSQLSYSESIGYIGTRDKGILMTKGSTDILTVPNIYLAEEYSISFCFFLLNIADGDKVLFIDTILEYAFNTPGNLYFY